MQLSPIAHAGLWLQQGAPIAPQAAQAPITQRCWLVQLVPHPPQWASSPSRSRQMPLQLRCPAAQQTPSLQLRPATQAMPQRPQWASSERVSRHTPPQLVSPAAQVDPLVHAGCPAAPHATHSPAWSRYPPLHCGAQRPDTHARLPLATVGQAAPQAPQWSTLVVSSTHPTPSQSVRLEVQRQLLDEQLCPAAQARRHAPQWATLLVRSTSQPLEGSPSQSP